MNYEESRAYIRAAELKKGIVLGLENMRELMRRLGDPQDELKYVHVDVYKRQYISFGASSIFCLSRT